MIEVLDQLDRELFLFLNSFHNSFMDSVMWFITGAKEWIPFYLIIIGYLFWKFRWNAIWVLAAIGLTITLADQFSSGFCKPFFERLRPSHQPDLEGLVHLITKNNGDVYRGGTYGFISSHATNTFALASFLFYLLRGHLKYVWLMFVWSAVVSYSRIYVGVHYPGDILAGALSGWLIGIFTSWLLLFLWGKYGKGSLEKVPAIKS